MYRKTTNEEGQIRTDQVQRIADGLLIPFDTANTDYIEYLEWINEGHEPEPAD